MDPLRGVAAFAVVIHHATEQSFGQSPSRLTEWLGAWGVILFFVISGFCIHLPQAAKEQRDGQLTFEWKKFYYRRARRLLPTHYAALVLSAAVGLFTTSEFVSTPTIAEFIAHVFMVHVFHSPWFYSINAVFWTIAVEVHFYLAYPLFLRLRKKLGGALPVYLFLLGLCIYVTAALTLTGGRQLVVQRLFLTYWWQWALGAYLADVYVQGRMRWWMRFVLEPGAWAAFAVASLAICVIYPFPAVFWLGPIICFLLLASLVTTADVGVFGISYVGSFSYSLYLIHPVALTLLLPALSDSDRGLQLALYASFALLFAWFFFLLVERHFLSRRQVVHYQWPSILATDSGPQTRGMRP